MFGLSCSGGIISLKRGLYERVQSPKRIKSYLSPGPCGEAHTDMSSLPPFSSWLHGGACKNRRISLATIKYERIYSVLFPSSGNTLSSVFGETYISSYVKSCSKAVMATPGESRGIWAIWKGSLPSGRQAGKCQCPWWLEWWPLALSPLMATPAEGPSTPKPELQAKLLKFPSRSQHLQPYAQQLGVYKYTRQTSVSLLLSLSHPGY